MPFDSADGFMFIPLLMLLIVPLVYYIIPDDSTADVLSPDLFPDHGDRHV